MQVVVTASNSNLSDDTHEVDVNRLYFEVVDEVKKRHVYDAAKERIKVLEEEVLRMREIQERILQHCLEEEV
ncbi:hypothetical protein A4A49_54368 [Nicotiana attenuata]|uniref:Uncharacterized protein n=1 Tax=Nicotiana attenuata TaxID=49451 RepID=A0A314KYJ5_NICAT|nr:hypothetical protein A4A49_54368 [Nicotiana attenuata]